MKSFPCVCGNELFFASSFCLKCRREAGMCPVCRQVVPLIAESKRLIRCGNSACGAALRKCVNFVKEQICNRCIDAHREPEETRCEYCRLTTVIPDLTVAGHRERWVRLERAKHRVLHIVDQIGLPIRQTDADAGPVLSFEFKADGPEPVHTGHDQGCITINLKEADHVEREKARVAFGEPQRTLVGHFRHDLGHYFWARLVDGRRDDACRALFGDERNASYSDALARYYNQGAKAGWPEQFVTAYATMHPWEDFAETFGTYLAMVSVLDTARHFKMSSTELDDFDLMVKSYTRIGLIANEFNRDMGLLDLVPEVFVPAVVEKLRFIHSLRTVPAVAAASQALPVSRASIADLTRVQK